MKGLSLREVWFLRTRDCGRGLGVETLYEINNPKESRLWIENLYLLKKGGKIELTGCVALSGAARREKRDVTGKMICEKRCEDWN